MTNMGLKQLFKTTNLILVFLILLCSSCAGQANEKSVNDTLVNEENSQPISVKQSTVFPQIHTNLNGMVSEFVRAMYQDKKGNYWFGTNGNGIIRYDGATLERVNIEQSPKWLSVRKIVEDEIGNIWFGTSSGLIKYDGKNYTIFSTAAGLQHEEIWGLAVDAKGIIWVGSVGGVSHFDGNKFTPFLLPNSIVENAAPMLSIKSAGGFVEDNDGYMWINNDGNGIFKYKHGTFIHLTNKNGLTDNNAGVGLKDSKGNIWIGSFNGGASKFDGSTFTNYTKEGVIKGMETGSFYEDSKGNIWFTAENIGVYKYDGTTFTLYTTENGLTSNVVQSICEDNKGQVWFGTWQGLCIFDGEQFVNARDKEPWTK
ncbi:MAG TPA: two-component regulator propeller domain-containing protein [Chitinophagales bacterium]|nr:two-component regulator propeller domain-containing protein [Chitinophagales bacterium]